MTWKTWLEEMRGDVLMNSLPESGLQARLVMSHGSTVFIGVARYRSELGYTRIRLERDGPAPTFDICIPDKVARELVEMLVDAYSPFKEKGRTK